VPISEQLLRAKAYFTQWCRNKEIEKEVTQAYVSGYLDAKHTYSRERPQILVNMMRAERSFRKPCRRRSDCRRVRFEWDGGYAIEIEGPPRFVYAMLSDYPALEQRLAESLAALEDAKVVGVLTEEEGVKRQIVDLKSEAVQ
jgi:hypothetical protein